MSDETQADKTAPEQLREHCWQPGQSGNPAGRPKSARSRLSEAFLAALADDFEENGVAAIKAARAQSPNKYLGVIAKLQPKQIEGTDDGPPIRTVNTVELVAPGHDDSKG